MPCLVQTKFVGQRVLVCLGMLTNTGHVIGHVIAGILAKKF